MPMVERAHIQKWSTHPEFKIGKLKKDKKIFLLLIVFHSQLVYVLPIIPLEVQLQSGRRWRIKDFLSSDSLPFPLSLLSSFSQGLKSALYLLLQWVRIPSCLFLRSLLIKAQIVHRSLTFDVKMRIPLKFKNPLSFYIKPVIQGYYLALHTRTCTHTLYFL